MHKKKPKSTVHSLGQNFLLSSTIANLMAKTVDKTDTIIEIGPGRGIVTKALSKRAKDVIAVEIDKNLVAHLTKLQASSQLYNVKFVNEDILKFLPTFKPNKNMDTKIKIVGSLPYYITSPILNSITTMKIIPDEVTLLIQKEVAKKITAKTPKNTYLATLLQSLFDTKYICDVTKDNFEPTPKVDSSVIRLTKNTQANQLQEYTIKKYQGFVRKAFSNPRKMLNKTFSEAELNKADINPMARPQEVETKKWIEMFLKKC